MIDSECTPPTSPAYIRKQMETLEQVRNPLLGGLYPQHGGITCAEVSSRDCDPLSALPFPSSGRPAP